MDHYSTRITRENPALIIFLVDMSASMGDIICYEGQQLSKATLLSRILNISINEITNFCKRIDGYRDYFNIAVIGYNDDTLTNLTNKYATTGPFCTINDLIQNNTDDIVYESIRQTRDGQKYVSSLKVKDFIKVTASGNTPTGGALRHTIKFVTDWIKERGLDTTPPIVINISDGVCTDVTPEEFLSLSKKLREIKTNDGECLFFNIHISSSDGDTSYIFPKSIDELPKEDRYSRMLYEASSPLPPKLNQEIAYIRDEQLNPEESYRAFGYNSSMNQLLRIIKIGSVSIIKPTTDYDLDK